jgi:hypothetical protein
MKITPEAEPVDVLDACELTEAERAKFDYLDWDALEAGSDSASFVRAADGTVHDLGEFTAIHAEREPVLRPLAGWDGYKSDSFFSGVVIRYMDSACESVLIATYAV